MRDDFSQRTKEKLAHRAGYRCSMPECGMPTRGAASDDEKTINLGEAAHITAASPGGPRYDPSLSSDLRKNLSNGIWLCATHAKLVDSDAQNFSVGQLREWKRQAERRSFNDVVSGTPNSATRQAHNQQPELNGLIEAAVEDLSGFQRALNVPQRPVSLNLRAKLQDGSSRTFDVNGLAAAIDAYDEITIVAQPGTGKTTTLLMLTAAVLQVRNSAAVFIPLAEWSSGRERFFPSILRRRAFRKFTTDQFEGIAQSGGITLVLDGWNELDETSRQTATTEIAILRREFPALRLMISSRSDDDDMPIRGPIVRVDALTSQQQFEMAEALRGDEGKLIVERALRTPGLRELITIPLYLSILLRQVKDTTLPTTREEILRTFVREQESVRTRMLRQEFQDRHEEVLTVLATEGTLQQTPTLSDRAAREIVGRTLERLNAERQINVVSSPMKALDVLVGAHLLVRSGDPPTLSFQHQQFQEWYASLWVETLMRSVLSGNQQDQKRLREQVLNMPTWEESILFACERMSRADDASMAIVASVVLESLAIDPLLSAEIIYRSSDALWARVADQVIKFVGRWHAERQVDRAFQFMINTGRPEFAEYIWPLISDPNSQVHLRALRAGRWFRPTVLGQGVYDRIAPLQDELRSHIVSGIAYESGIDGIELAADLAKKDAAPAVKLAVVNALLFRHAERLAAEILENAPPEVWRDVAAKWDENEVSDPALSERLKAERQRAMEGDNDPERKLYLLLERTPEDASTAQTVESLIQTIDFSPKANDNGWALHLARQRFPEQVARGLLFHLERGQRVPFRSDDLLRDSHIIVEAGPVADRLMAHAEGDKDVGVAASVAGPKLLSDLIGQIRAVNAKLTTSGENERRALSEEYFRLLGIITNSQTGAFARAILDRANTKDVAEITLLSELIARHGRDHEKTSLNLDSDIHSQLTQSLVAWGYTLLNSPDATREQLSHLPKAAERLGSPSLLPILQKLLSEELARREEALQLMRDGLRNGRRTSDDPRMYYAHNYRDAFIAIGDDATVALMYSYLADATFGTEAVRVLYGIWRRKHSPESERDATRSWPDFSEVMDRRSEKTSGKAPKTFPFAEETLSIVSRLIDEESSEEQQKHALELATIAFGMPYLGKDALISALLALPRPAIEKQRLLTVLVLAGEIIPSQLIMSGIDELFEAAKTKPWLLHDSDGFRLHDWLKLLPFTENPRAVLDVMPRIDAQKAAPWNFRSLLISLGYAPSPEAEVVLKELARLNPGFLRQHEWLLALTRRNTESAGKVLLDLLDDIAAGTSDIGFRFAQDLAHMIERHPQFRAEIYARYQNMKSGPASALLERSIADASDHSGVLLLVRVTAERNGDINSSHIYTALRHALVREQPSTEMSGARELYGLPAAALRKDLFQLVLKGTPAESKLAAECLDAIDDIRDSYGGPELEPRHPDIETGVPWPRIVMGARAS